MHQPPGNDNRMLCHIHIHKLNYLLVKMKPCKQELLQVVNRGLFRLIFIERKWFVVFEFVFVTLADMLK